MAGTAAERENRPPAESPMPQDWEASVAQVDKVLGLAQAHLVDRLPGIGGITVADPTDNRGWYIDLSRRDSTGKLNSLRFQTTSSSDTETNHPEMFQLAAIRTKPGLPPLLNSDHVDMGDLVGNDKKSQLEKATEAEAALRRILDLGTDEEEAAKAEAKERGLQRVYTEMLTLAGLTFEEAFEYGDIAWGLHKGKLQKHAEIEAERARRATEPEAEVPEPTPEEKAEMGRRAEEVEKIWDALEKDPKFRKDIATGERQMREGKYYSIDILRTEIPQLHLRRRPTAGRRLSSE